jgi:hypothetical protein
MEIQPYGAIAPLNEQIAKKNAYGKDSGEAKEIAQADGRQSEKQSSYMEKGINRYKVMGTAKRERTVNT